MPSGSDDPTTEELRVVQTERERAERAAAERAPEDEALAHERRADRAAYLRGKLDEQADSLGDTDGA